MGLKCRISYRDGVTSVVDNKGNESELYGELLAYTGNEKEALDLWAVANSDRFMGTGESTTVKEVVAYMDSTEASTRRLSTSEEFQVVDFMRRSGETSLSELYSKLTNIFKPEGTFEIDMDAAVESGIFSQQEINDLDVNKMQDILLKIEGQLATKDIVVEPYSQEHDYVDGDNKSIFGTAQKVSQKEFDNDIIRVVKFFTNKDSFLEGIKTLPYSDFVKRFQEDDAYAESIMEKFKGLKKIPKLSLIGTKLSEFGNELYTTIKNTILVNSSDISIEAEIDYLNKIPQEIWEENTEEIKEILKEVEQTLADMNLDIVGLANNIKNRERVMNSLYAADTLVKNVSEESLQAFIEAHSVMTETPSTIIAEKLEDKYVGLNIISLHTELDANSLFENYGLIEVGENLYHKIDQNASVDILKDFIYDQFIEGAVEIPSKFITAAESRLLENKPVVLENISMFLMSRPKLSKITNQELYSAYQVVFDHSPIENKERAVRGLTRIKTDENYLKSEFISDFYNYILSEKVKNSIIYRSTLSKFQINDKGISLTEEIPSIKNLKFSEELGDYIRLKRDSDMKYLLEATEDVMSEDLLYLNFPENAKVFEGKMIIDGNFIITNPTVDNYISVNGELYRKEIVRDGANLFVKITTSKDNVYLTSNLDFTFDREAANELFNEYALLGTETVSYSDFQSVVEKSRLNDNMSPELKELSTLKDKSYVFSQIEEVITVKKDGKEIGSLVYKIENGVYTNPKVTVAEVHRGKGIGTELYLQLFDKAKKNDKIVGVPIEETPQSKNIFERMGSLSETQATPQFQQDTITEVVSTPQQIVDAVLVKLKETGLANEVYSMTSSQIEEKLVSLGVTVNIAKQVIAWHGTSNPQKDILKVTNKNESRYGELLSGNYFGGREMATWFSGKIVEQSLLFKVAIEEGEFAVVDMKGKTPVGTEELFEDEIMSKEEFDNLLAKKKSGEIKGIILENSTEEGFPDAHTQYLVFDESVMEKLQTIEYTELETNEAPVSKVFLAMQTAGISVTPNGFVHNGEVYLNTDNPNILNTQVHEFGHLFNSWAKANRPDIYNKGIELIKSEDGKAYIDFVKENQPNLEGEKLYEEALTQAIGDQGQRFVETNARNSFTEWLSELWESLKYTMGITEVSAESLQYMTLNDFAKAVSVDLMKGGSVKSGFLARDQRRVGFSYNTEKLARERFNFSELKKIGEGSDRVTFDMGDGKVLKVSKTARGLRQNYSEGEPLDFVSDVYETGLNYVVAQKAEPIRMSKEFKEGLTKDQLKEAKSVRKDLRTMLDKFFEFSQSDFNNRTQDIQDVLAEYGMDEMLSWEVLWNDFTAEGNWGILDGKPIHVDGGTFAGVGMIDDYRGKEDLSDEDFRDIYYRSRETKKLLDDTDKFTRFQIVGENAAISGEQRSNLKKAKMEYEIAESARTGEGIFANMPIENTATPKEILLITGWQIGADGKWRLEIPDGKLVGNIQGENKLGDIYDAPEVYKMYPDLANIDVKINIRSDGAENSWYMPKSDSIEINVKQDYRVLQDLVHELQHAIQFREGFAIGGSYDTFIQNPEKFFTEEVDRKYQDLIRKDNIFRSLLFIAEYATEYEFSEIPPSELFSEEFIRENFDGVIQKETTPEEVADFYEDLPEAVKSRIDQAKEDYGYDEAMGEIYELHDSIQEELVKESLFNKYQRLAGEVEARNVSDRLGMSFREPYEVSIETEKTTHNKLEAEEFGLEEGSEKIEYKLKRGGVTLDTIPTYGLEAEGYEASKAGAEEWFRVAVPYGFNNVKVRRKMLAETEDTPRVDQIVFTEAEDSKSKQANIDESIENTSSIFDSRLELLDLYSSKEEAQIKKDTDCG